jgi:hypothetical protein
MHTVAKLGVVASLLIAASVASAQVPSAGAPAKPVTRPAAGDALYQGTWITTKTKKLNGTSNCLIKSAGKDKWEGRFWGLWERVPFEYTVEFSTDRSAMSDKNRNPRSIPVVGKAVIDGANYDWKGQLSASEFNIQFTGDRYEGSLELKRVGEQIAAREATQKR